MKTTTKRNTPLKHFAVPLAMLALAACTTTEQTPPLPPGLIMATMDEELAAQCIGRIRQGDVPVVPEGMTRPLNRDTAIYIRKLEDAYEICETVVRESVELGQRNQGVP